MVKGILLPATEPPPACAPVNVYVTEATPEPPALSIAVNVTVTFELFQPAPFAAGVGFSVGFGGLVWGLPDWTLSLLLARRWTVCPTGLVVAHPGPRTEIGVSFQLL